MVQFLLTSLRLRFEARHLVTRKSFLNFLLAASEVICGVHVTYMEMECRNLCYLPSAASFCPFDVVSDFSVSFKKMPSGPAVKIRNTKAKYHNKFHNVTLNMQCIVFLVSKQANK